MGWEGLGVSGLGGKGLGFTRIFGGLGDWEQRFKV